MDLMFLSDTDRDVLRRVNEASHSNDEDPNSVVEMFRKVVPEYRNKVAVVGSDGELTYDELDRLSDAIASMLIDKGVEPDAFVGISVDRSTRMLAALVGVWKAGAAYVPLDPEYPEERLAYMMESAGLSALITQSSIATRIPTCDCPTVYLDNDWEYIKGLSGGELPDSIRR